MDELIKLERKIQGIYDRSLQPLAEKLAFDLPTGLKDATGQPSVLFLGNHSSGKSSFINYLLEAKLQKSGLAPTDDGFTIITYGETKDEFDGQTVVTHPDLVYKQLQHLGPAFLARLRLKTFPHDLLKSLTLIDSPGMIDAAGSGSNRGYDFSQSVRYFAENADLILFFFDPDKPGTTGETVSIFTETLAGLEYKLLIVLNKVDLFQNIRDFARTYGTLCWNLSKTIRSKDIPHIFNTYLPNQQTSPQRDGPPPVPLEDFDASRDEVLAEVRRAPTRRADNLVSDLFNNAHKLEIHTRVCHAVTRAYTSRRWRWWGGVALILVLTGAATWLTRNAQTITTPALILFIGLALASGLWFLSRYLLGKFREELASMEVLDQCFAEVYREELLLHDRADLRATWESVRKQTLNTVKAVGPERLSHSFSSRRALRRLEDVIELEIPQLRRDIAAYHRELREKRAVSGVSEE